MRNTTECQRQLIALGYLASGEDDGVFGQKTLDGFNHFRASKGEPPIGPHEFTLSQVNADLFPDDVQAAPIPKPSIFNQIGTLLSLIDLLKGKTMTTDQLTGLLRTAIIGLSAFLAGKGYIPNISPELAATIATAAVGVWSWISNRPKTITPIGK